MEFKMSNPLAGQTYPLDPTGKLPSNRIANEYHVITAANWRTYHFIVPKKGPYFADSLDIIYRDAANNQVALREGVDWVHSFWFIGASRACAKQVYGGITFLNTKLTGSVRISYQTIGGEFVLDDQAISEILGERIHNPLITSWEVIANVPKVFPPEPHEWNLVDMVGAKDVNDSIQEIVQLLRQKSGASLDSHLQDFNNPHNVNRQQVGLGNVMNYPIVSLIDAGTSTSNAHYTTPASVRKIIDNAVKNAFLEFKDRTDNPHNVTAAQTGTYDRSQIDALLAEKVSNTSIAFDSVRFAGRTFQEAKAEFLNGTAANATKFNNRTYNQVVNDILTAAGDRDSFGGRNPNDFKAWVLEGEAADATLMNGKNEEELAEYLGNLNTLNAFTLNHRTDEQLKSWILQGKAYDSERLGGFTYDEMVARLSTDVGGNATRLSGKTLEEIINMARSGTAANADKVYNKTLSELSALILSGTANNATLFNNKDYDSVKADILSGTAANANTVGGRSVDEIIAASQVAASEASTNATTLNGRTDQETKNWVLEGVAAGAATFNGYSLEDHLNYVYEHADTRYLTRRVLGMVSDPANTGDRWYKFMEIETDSITDDNQMDVARVQIDNLFKVTNTSNANLHSNVRATLNIDLKQIHAGQYNSAVHVVFEMLGKYIPGLINSNLNSLVSKLNLGYLVDTENNTIQLCIKLPYNHELGHFTYYTAMNGVYAVTIRELVPEEPTEENPNPVNPVTMVHVLPYTKEAERTDVLYSQTNTSSSNFNTQLNNKVTELNQAITNGDAATKTAVLAETDRRYGSKSDVATNKTNISNLTTKVSNLESGDKVANATVITEGGVLKTKVDFNNGSYIKAYIYNNSTAGSKSVSASVDSGGRAHIYIVNKSVNSGVHGGAAQVVQYGIFELNYKDTAVIDWAGSNIQHVNGTAPELEVGKVYLFNAMMVINTSNNSIEKIVLNDLGSIGNAY